MNNSFATPVGDGYGMRRSSFKKDTGKVNVEELKRIGAKSIGAKFCISITKLDEGGYNKVFKLVMDNGSVAIARIPCPNAGPAFKTTASEVATMDFARTILKIPVPKVHAWSAMSDNPVEAEYFLMEEACGTSLGDVWKDMGIHSKDKIVEEIVSIEQKMLSVSFCRYGNIYFAKDSFPGCEKAVVSGDISEELKKEVEERFAIGPMVDNVFWRRDQTSTPMDRGPWKTAEDYLKALANNQVTWLSQYAPRETPPNMIQELAAQESPDAHIALYKKFLDISPAWKGEEKAGVSHQVERSIVQYLYEIKTKETNPWSTEIIDVPQRAVRKQTIVFAGDSWEGGILPFRQCLIQLERYWDEMRHDAACPIHFTEEDLQNHMRDAEGFNEQADFWDRMEGLIARDGWISNERYEEALDLFANLREEQLKQLTGEERSDFEKQSRWAERNVDRTDGS
ncbi:related to FMP29 Found in Mitochondrial Proteome [Rhynchosporium secalis]|uniref:Altered inheritance of mitochondria protein 9, mitochondrial n=1 Tax=Rhynchosporium secalis TaxID=38038 RepID=A0A1E1MHQ6_RHYSE|nr:related to FMP29 Found in Mitochondrial Proteome [Rhynchosporium secalis]